MIDNEFISSFFVQIDLMDSSLRKEVEAVCSRQTVEAQHVVYEQGMVATAVYIVASGVCEAYTVSPDRRLTRRLGHMERGDFFGDLGVLTGNPRLATVRACEKCELLQIEKGAFFRLLDRSTKLSTYFARNIGRRLYETSMEANRQIYSSDLAGNLQYFDLLSIFQAITGMRASGELRLNDSAHDLIGSFHFRNGRVEHARYIHLQGLEAVWQGFVQSATEGTFNFQGMTAPTLPYAEEFRLDLPSDELLLQGATRRDTFQALPESLRAMQGRLTRRAGEFASSAPETEACARQIWELIARRPQPLNSLWRRLNYSNLTFLEAVQEQLTAGQISLTPDDGRSTQPIAPV